MVARHEYNSYIRPCVMVSIAEIVVKDVAGFTRARYDSRFLRFDIVFTDSVDNRGEDVYHCYHQQQNLGHVAHIAV